MKPELPSFEVNPTTDFVELLRSLWEGDRDATGYQSSKIVQALCTMAPLYTEPTEQWVLNHVRAGYVQTKDCDEAELEIIRDGLERWRKAGKPRATFVPSVVKKELVSGE